MSFAAALAQPAAKRTVLALLTGAVRLVGWTDHGGGVFSAEVPYLDGESALIAVEVDGAEVDFLLEDFVVFLDGVGDPRALHVVAVLEFRFATEGREIDGEPFYGRLSSAPRLRLAVPEFFGGVGQLGGGNLTLLNGDGFFDRLGRVVWRTAALEMALEVK